MSKKRTSNLWDVAVSADLLPVMNIMFLLIPALLMAMEFASMASISVSPPKMCAACGEPDPNKPAQAPLAFKVMIRSDGFLASTQGANMPEIPLRSGEPDYAALAEASRTLKAAHPDEVTVTVTAESDVPMATLVRTLDTLRGDGCKLAGMNVGEQPSAQCLFFSPVIES